MACADDHDVTVQLLFDGLGNFGDQHRSIIRLADILLNFVEHDEGARHPTIMGDKRKRILGGPQKFLRCYVGRLRRELRLDQLFRFRLATCEGPVAVDHGACKGTADIEIVEFTLERFSGGLDRRLYLLEVTLRVKPQAELCLGVLFREAGSAQQNSQDGDPHIIGCAARQ